MSKTSSKKVQIDKNQATIFAVVAVAAIVTVMSLMVAKGLWSQSRYLSKVIDKKEKALTQLETNKEAVSKLTSSYNTFDGQFPNVLGGSKTGVSDRDGSNGTIVLDALPNKYDFPALTSSIEKILTGYQIESIAGTDDSVAQTSNASPNVVEMPFSFEATSNYVGLKDLISRFDKSIRPFSIVKLELTGTESSVKANFSAKTYYQPSTSLKVTEETVQ